MTLARSQLRVLEQRRVALQETIVALERSVATFVPLVDGEGYPLISDLEEARRQRQTKGSLAAARRDFAELMQQIEQLLPEAFAKQAGEGVSTEDGARSAALVVASVLPGSAASRAGVCIDDIVVDINGQGPLAAAIDKDVNTLLVRRPLGQASIRIEGTPLGVRFK